MKSPRSHLVIFVILASFLVVAGAVIFKLWAENRELSARSPLPPIVFQQAIVGSAFLNSNILKSEDEFVSQKDKIASEQKDFVTVDLVKKQLTLYKKGKASKVFKVLSKGRDGSWWETPSGVYSALSKEVTHFSSIGRVWMPWAVQFYGNFFIHGWPYYADGRPVEQSYSGGCIRLSTDDAEEVFNFIGRGMPILIFDDEASLIFTPALRAVSPELNIPTLSAKSILVLDLGTGEVVLNKNADLILPTRSLTKLMTATVASEIIYLGKSVLIRPQMLGDRYQSYFLEAGNRYQVFDLMYPMLMRGSNAAAKALAGFVGEESFVKQMNEKARSLGMENSIFSDATGVKKENLSSLKDLATLAKYILEKRSFIFDVSKGKYYDSFGETSFAQIDNLNNFSSEAGLIGISSGEGNPPDPASADVKSLANRQDRPLDAAEGKQEFLLGVWRLKDGRGFGRNVMIGILESENRVRDAQAIRAWLEARFGLK